MKYIYLIFSLSLLIFSCQQKETTIDPFQHIEGKQLKATLQKAMEAAGGLDNWKKIKSLKFKKEFRLLKESGAIEKAALQTHDYSFLPKQNIEISWQDSSKQKHKITYKNASAKKRIDGNLDQSAKQQSLINTVLSSTFIISIPFNLLDKGVDLTYEGTEIFEQKKVHVIKAIYNPTNNPQHTTPDIWWHYFDAQTYRQLGYMVFHVDHFSLVKNLSDTKVGPFTFIQKRNSYRADSLKNILYLRADYEYSDYVLE